MGSVDNGSHEEDVKTTSPIAKQMQSLTQRTTSKRFAASDVKGDGQRAIGPGDDGHVDKEEEEEANTGDARHDSSVASVTSTSRSCTSGDDGDDGDDPRCRRESLSLSGPADAFAGIEFVSHDDTDEVPPALRPIPPSSSMLPRESIKRTLLRRLRGGGRGHSLLDTTAENGNGASAPVVVVPPPTSPPRRLSTRVRPTSTTRVRPTSTTKGRPTSTTRVRPTGTKTKKPRKLVVVGVMEIFGDPGFEVQQLDEYRLEI
jgi:hypothetical protein